ncbi:MAG: Omp28-related outer membrane protein [Lentimicrobiaceae bacterium]|nr:Omp28-related outer membrane protein [Lentimicrobiaceae bacterium]
MKKSVLFICMFFSILWVHAQQVERDMVVLEIGTGTWCQYCPGAALGADDLITNGKDVAVVENHNGDIFANTYSNARNSYYGISSFPTAKFDGVLTVVGGNHTQSMYSSYLPKYNQRKAIPSSFTLEIFGSNTGADYTVLVKAKQVAATTSTNMKIHLALTQSEIAYNWQGQTELNFVNRLMMPNQSGTTVALDPTDSTQLVTLTFTLNTAWPAENCELVAFIQDNTSKEILQGTKVALEELSSGTVIADFDTDTTTVCEAGIVHYTDLSTASPLPPTTWNWSFPGGDPATSTEQNPVVTYLTSGNYNVSLTVTNGLASNTTLRADFITVNSVPTQAGIPYGETIVCTNTSVSEYLTSGATKANSYIWQLSPLEAGEIVGNDTVGTVTWNDNYTGTAYVSVKGSNTCGEGFSSDNLEITKLSAPTVFEITGGGSYCEGTLGVEVGLSNSESGKTYQLFLNETSTGNPVPGTGEALSFGNQILEGSYTVKAYSYGQYCEQPMQGSTTIIKNLLPEIPQTPTGNVEICPAEEPFTTYTTQEANNVLSYSWELLPAEAGTIDGNGLTATVTWNTSYTGLATVKVKGINDCGESAFSSELQVSVLICDGITENNNSKPSIIPNPNNGTFSVMFKATTDKATVKVVNAYNAVVFEKTGVMGSSNEIFNLNLPSGIYLLVIQHGNSISSEKLIIR